MNLAICGILMAAQNAAPSIIAATRQDTPAILNKIGHTLAEDPGRDDVRDEGLVKTFRKLDPSFHNDKFRAVNMKIPSFFLLIVILAFLPFSHAADITGIITFKGTPPTETEITPLMDNVDCAAMYKDAPTTHFYMVGPKGELADVVVSLKGVTGKSTGANAPPAVMDQRGCVYTPAILAIQTGQKLIVKNSDTCVHNVHVKPTVAGNEESNLVQMPGGADLTFTFPQPESFLKFQCDVHPWMFAWVTVVDSPFFSVSGKDGKFIIKNVPPGKYTVEAAHRKLGAQTQEIEIKDTDAAINFTFRAK